MAKSAELQLRQATELIRNAIHNLEDLRYGVEPSLDHAKKALRECDKSHVCAVDLLDRIPT